jgi:hypothetical protein
MAARSYGGGALDSLNVSNAAAVALFALSRPRAKLHPDRNETPARCAIRSGSPPFSPPRSAPRPGRGAVVADFDRIDANKDAS